MPVLKVKEIVEQASGSGDPCGLFSVEELKQTALLELHETFVKARILMKVFSGFHRLIMICWIVQHGSAHAVFTLLHF